MQCWFLSFLWRRDEMTVWHPVEAATKEHPIDYMNRLRRTNPQHEFRLMFFQPIPNDVYLRATKRDEPERAAAAGGG